MKSRGLQFLCSVHTIYVALPQWNFFFFLSWEGRRVETEPNLVNLLYVNSTRTWAWNRLESGFILSLPPAAVALSLDPGTPGGSPRSLLGFQKIKNDLHNNTKILFAFLSLSFFFSFPFFLLCWPFALIVPEALVGEIPSPPESRQRHRLGLVVVCVPCYCGPAAHKTSPGSLENVLDEAVKIIKLIKFWPLSTSLFNILYDKMGSTYQAQKALQLRPGVGCLSPGSSAWTIVWAESCTSCFLNGGPFYWLGRLTAVIQT